ncbi:8396_t:CDS:2 [Funneliformis caledonium]|uniref:8396_t:CDS:1 n=1 Tax=Funneliformis caledonium TaxID=1117310 RepID=A0A9N9A1F5_9GLOM|nr:8396_t:CDS:2 [Funneliformis caledonium]
MNRENFIRGISILFKTEWTALKLAVDMQWGGHDSEDKRDWLINVIAEYFDKNGKGTDVDDLETILNQIMSDEFNTLLEDDSAYQISQDLIKMYNECKSSTMEEDEKMDIDNSTTPSKLSNRPIIDDDGFTLVTRRK